MQIPAGAFGEWLSKARASLLGDCGADVLCGDCTGCCTSGYSVQLRPEDARARAAIPAEFVSRAPGFPSGHLTMRPLPDGTCPMLREGKCSIYAQRPQTCRDFDCRIFAAAGVDAGGAEKAAINRRVRQWQFTYPSETDKLAHDAVMAAASFIRNHPGCFTRPVPSAPMGIAVLAIKCYALFLDPSIQTKSDVEIASAINTICRDFETGQ
jgi:uncharacterized protein